MNRINIIGTTGSGKSTLAKALAKKLDVKCIEMDQLFWKPNWEESGDKEFFLKLENALNEERWVLDGNYSRTNAIKWRDVDTIIWVDYSYWRTFFQLLSRTLKRCITKQRLWSNNTESWSKMFSKSSILLWFKNYYPKNKIRYADLLKNPDYSHIKFIRLQSPKKTKQFLESL